MAEATVTGTEVRVALSGGRTAAPMPRRYRRRCGCSCGTRATHVGYRDGIALMSGCEFHVRHWVRDPLQLTRQWLARDERRSTQ